MNKIKSLFISVYPMLAMSISIYGIYMLWTLGMNFFWLGAVLINLPIMLFISRVMLFKDLPRTSARFPLITLIAIIGVTLVIYASLQATTDKFTVMERTALILSLVSFGMYLLYNFWYSTLGRGSSIDVQVNQQLPSFSLTDVTGNTINSDDLLGTPVVYIFYRGNWCPLCMAQIKEVASNYRELAALGASIVLISPQPEKKTRNLAAKFDVPFDFYTDMNGAAAKFLGIFMKNGTPAGLGLLGYDTDTVYPTVIITNKAGVIVYSDFTDNYRVRPEPKEFIEILKANVA